MKTTRKKNRSKGQCEVVSPAAWDTIDCGNAICPAEKCDLNHMLNGNNFISFDGSEIKGECIEVKIYNAKGFAIAPSWSLQPKTLIFLGSKWQQRYLEILVRF